MIDVSNAFNNYYNSEIFPKIKFNKGGSTLDCSILAIQTLYEMSFIAGKNLYDNDLEDYELPDPFKNSLLQNCTLINNAYIENISERVLYELLLNGFEEGVKCAVENFYY